MPSPPPSLWPVPPACAVFVAAVILRLVVGALRPDLGFWQGALLGLVAAVCLGPTLHRACTGQEVLETPRQRGRHLAAVALTGVLYWHLLA